MGEELKTGQAQLARAWGEEWVLGEGQALVVRSGALVGGLTSASRGWVLGEGQSLARILF